MYCSQTRSSFLVILIVSFQQQQSTQPTREQQLIAAGYGVEKETAAQRIFKIILNTATG